MYLHKCENVNIIHLYIHEKLKLKTIHDKTHIDVGTYALNNIIVVFYNSAVDSKGRCAL